MPNVHEALTLRELEVLRLAASGKKDRQVAEELKVSESTVTTYWYRIKMKLLVRSRSEAIAVYASQQRSPEAALAGSLGRVAQRAGARPWFEVGAPFVSFVVDGDGRFLSGAGNVAAYVGVAGEPPTEDDWNWFVSKTLGADGLRELKAKGGWKGRVEVRGRVFDVYALSSARPSSKRAEFAVTAIDVTRHVKRLAALESERDRLRSVLDQAPNPFFIWDFKQGAVTYANRCAHHVLGRTPEQLRALGWAVLDLVHPDDRDEAMSRISQLAHMRMGDIQNLPLRVQTLEGPYVAWDTIATPFSLNEDGSVREFLCSCFDIGSYDAELGALRAKLRELSERYDALVQCLRNTPVGLMTVDPQGNVLSANPEGLRILRADRDGWEDAYDLRAERRPAPKTLLKLGEDWLEAIAKGGQPTNFQSAELSDYLGNRRRFVLSVRAVRRPDGELSRYGITFYDHADLGMMDPRALDAVRGDRARNPEG